MSATPAPSLRAESAVAAFLRGIERRGLSLAQAQCGDSKRAREATDGVAKSFGREAALLPITRWPALYWQSLLAQSSLRTVASQQRNDLLAQLSPAPRAALLLRLVAGLDQHQGADVLRVSPEAYRHALYRALSALQERGIDEQALLELRDRLQAQANGMPERDDPPQRADAPVARQSLHSVPRESKQMTSPKTTPRAPRWVRRALMIVLLVLVIGFGATFWTPKFHHGAPATGGFETISGPVPAATMSATATAVGGADFGMLATPTDQAVAHDLPLYSWYAAGAGATDSPSGAAIVLPESSAPETSAPDADVQDCADAESSGCAPAADADNAQ